MVDPRGGCGVCSAVDRVLIGGECPYSDLLAKSRDMHINLSALLESALMTKLAAAENKKWKQNKKLAIKAYNTPVNEHGCFGDSVREF